MRFVATYECRWCRSIIHGEAVDVASADDLIKRPLTQSSVDATIYHECPAKSGFVGLCELQGFQPDPNGTLAG